VTDEQTKKKMRGGVFSKNIWERQSERRNENIIVSGTLKTENNLNACVFILLSNDDLYTLIITITEFEKNFNSKYNYPYVMVSNEPLENFFKLTIQKYTKSKIEFGLIPKHQWSVPDHIDINKLKISIKKIGTVNYRHMCRYYAGFFWRHELTIKYDYYLRLDSHVNFPCEIKEDPFLKMYEKNLSYGFILSDGEQGFYESAMPTLFENVRNWNSKPVDNEAIKFISDDNGISLNKHFCMFYNNFEMAHFSVFRSESYLNYFNHLDKSGGFFYERWVNF
jgi:alpha 1,2-mannosyltransferase